MLLPTEAVGVCGRVLRNWGEVSAGRNEDCWRGQAEYSGKMYAVAEQTDHGRPSADWRMAEQVAGEEM